MRRARAQRAPPCRPPVRCARRVRSRAPGGSSRSRRPEPVRADGARGGASDALVWSFFPPLLLRSAKRVAFGLGETRLFGLLTPTGTCRTRRDLTLEEAQRDA